MRLKTGFAAVLGVGAMLCMGGCGTSPPVRLHGVDAGLAVPAASGSAAMLVEILPVALPERVDRPQLVLAKGKEGEGGPRVLDDDRWIAPLGDEIRGALAASLWSSVRAIDVYRAAIPDDPEGLPRYRLAVRFERLDVDEDGRANIEASWTARRLPRGSAAACRIALAVPALEAGAFEGKKSISGDQGSGGEGAAAEAAAAGAARGVRRLGDVLAGSLARLQAGETEACPENGVTE